MAGGNRGNSGNSHQRKTRQKAEERMAKEVAKILSPRREGKSLASGDVDAANAAPRILNRSSIEAYVFFILGGGYAALTAFGVSINFLAGVGFILRSASPLALSMDSNLE